MFRKYFSPFASLAIIAGATLIALVMAKSGSPCIAGVMFVVGVNMASKFMENSE